MNKESKTKKTTTVQVSKSVRKTRTGRAPRLYVKALFAGFRRARTSQTENQARLKIENVKDRDDATFYLGKRVVHVYKSSKGYNTSWGKITKVHGNNGTVLAKFRTNLPPRAIGSTLRVMLYPNKN